MKKILLKLFVKNYQDKENPVVRAKYGVLAGVFGIITNLLVCSVKIIVGLLSASVSILADGINNLSDAGASIVTFIGFHLSSKPADEEHPFGHERYEYLSGMIVSIIILIIGGSLLIDSIKKIISPVEMQTGTYIYIILAISILFKFIQALFYKSLAKDIDSTTLKASSVDSLNDCISTAAVFVGLIIFDLTGFAYIDGIVGIIIAIFIIVAGVKLLKETMDPLLGEMPSKEDVDTIVNNITKYEGVLGIHDLVIHSYGPNKTFVTVHCEVDSKVDIMLSHDMVDNIEADFKKEFNIDLVIHMDPVDIHDEETQNLKKDIAGIIKKYDENLRFHDFRVVKGVTHTNVLFDLEMPITYNKTPLELKNDIAQLIKEYNSFLNAVIVVDHFYNRNN